MKEYFWLASKYLRKRGVRSWLTLLGIFIGVAAVISLITLGDGLRLAVNSQFGISTTQIITVQAGGIVGFGPPGSWVTKPLVKDDVTAIKKLDSIESAIPRNIETVQAEFNNNLIFSVAVSVPEGRDKKQFYEFLELEAYQGRLLEDSDDNKVILGYDYSKKEKSGFNKKIEVGDKIRIQGDDFRVVGILKKKGSFIFDKTIMMNDGHLRELMGYGNNVDIIAVKVKSKDLMDKSKEDIEELLRKRRNVEKGEEDFEVSTPEATLATLNNILSGIQIFIVIIASISIIVGAIGIANTMTTSVLERKKDIGIMKAIGAKNSDIFYQSFVEAGLMGFIGGALGIIIGTIIGYFGTIVINYLIGSSAELKINFILIISSLIGSFLIGAVSGIIPAMKAAKQNPIDVLRD